ncbi:MAG: hypothetical protein BroJett025_02100 [Patescibacteria group bacterium]|nr:MAG: hypothetical protein BroJett025_02100 [Patescibacteria group bacterium]
MNELNKILNSGEEILWEGKPAFWPFFISSFAGIIFGLIFMAAGSVPLIQGIKSGNYFMILFPHFWIGFLFVFGAPLYTALVYRHIFYMITNKRVLFQKGLIGRDFQIIDFDKVTNADVKVGLLDILFGRKSGSIQISTAGTVVYTKNGMSQRPYTLSHIADPYEVFKFFKEISHAVKSDIEYPNQFRPQNNPGYNTTFKPEDTLQK